MNITSADLLTQYRAGVALWPIITDVEEEFDLPPFLLWAVASRETNMQRQYAEGQVHADGHGWGLFGADDRWNTLDLPHFASDPEEQARLAARTLRANFKRLGLWVDAANAYGPAWARPDYGVDVIERATYLATNAGGPMPDAPSAAKALDWLRSHLGAGENPPGSNRNFITTWGGLGPVAWCDICFWASECAAWGVYDSRRLPDDYPIATDYSWGDAYVPSTRYHLRAAGRYGRVPAVGDAAIFVWAGAPEVSTLVGDTEPWAQAPGLPPVDLTPPGPPEVTRGPRPVWAARQTGLVAFEDIGDHIGRVEAWVDRAGNQRTDECQVDEWDRTVITLEGNADNALVRKRRPMSLIDGFGRMPYPVPKPEPQEEDDMALPLFGDAPEGRGGGLWMLFGGFRKRVHTTQVWDDYQRVGSKHIGDVLKDSGGKFPVAMFDGTIDIEAALAAQIVVTPGENGVIDYKAVGEAVADELYGRLAG